MPACDTQRPALSRGAPEAKPTRMCARFRARAPFSAVDFLLRLEWSSRTMSYDYHQSWSRDAGPRGSGPGGGGGVGSRGPGGGGGGGGGGRGGRGRHPGHLKGREIGLWYARKQTQKNKEAERQEVWRARRDAPALARARCSLGRTSGNGLRVLTQANPAAAPVHALLADLRTGGEC